MSGKILNPQNAKIIYSLANEHGCTRQFKVPGSAFPAVFCYFMSFSAELISESRTKMLRGNNPLHNTYCHNVSEVDSAACGNYCQNFACCIYLYRSISMDGVTAN